MSQSTKPISPLRQRMLDDMRLRKLSPKTQSGYIRAVVNLTRFLKRSPDTAEAEDLRGYQLHLVEQGTSSGSVNANISGLRFFFEVTVDRPGARFASWYEMWPRSQGTTEGQSATFADMERRLPELQEAAERICGIASEMKGRQKEDPLQWASYTYPCLISLSEVTMTWRLLDMAVVAEKCLDTCKASQRDYYKAKILQATYFSDITLPQAKTNMETCLREGREILEIPDGAF